MADTPLQRIPIPSGEPGRCLHCRYLREQTGKPFLTGSKFEWPCTLLGGWVCETHCYEIQDESFHETRERVAAQIGWERSPEELPHACTNCPLRCSGKGS
jgi:hypothetical protein